MKATDGIKSAHLGDLEASFILIMVKIFFYVAFMKNKCTTKTCVISQLLQRKSRHLMNNLVTANLFTGIALNIRSRNVGEYFKAQFKIIILNCSLHGNRSSIPSTGNYIEVHRAKYIKWNT